MKNRIASNKALQKTFTAADVRDMTRTMQMTVDPDSIFDKMAKEISAIPSGPKREQKIEKTMTGKALELLMAEGVGNQLAIAETVDEHYRPLIVSFARQLIDEYKCQGSSEKALAEMAALAYIRTIVFSKWMQRVGRIEFATHEINGYYGTIGKELDRANRHYQTAITTLRQLKQPPLSVSVNAKTAFVAQNQQINAVSRPPEQINEAK